MLGHSSFGSSTSMPMSPSRRRHEAAPVTPVEGRLAAALADRYRIERELGAGGMATVYLAEDLKHRRQVAIKVLHAELSAVLGPERFLKEIELTASLQHPHILPLFDSGSADGLLYYVMPFVEGETLRARLERETQLPVDDALLIAREVADALSYAHDKGVVHRDIKPENILLQNGHALVADFGIALAVEQAGGGRLTQTGLSLGTPQYMAPEQAMGERSVDARADIYALGAVTYEMLAGQPPFTGPNAQAILAQVITAEPPSLAAQRRSVPEHVDLAVTRALEKLPADRFADARSYAAALSGALTGRPPASRTVPRTRATRSTRRRTIAAITGTALIALAFGALVGQKYGHGTYTVAPPARFLVGDIHIGGGPGFELFALSPDGQTVVYFSDAHSGSSLWVRRIDDTHATMLPQTREAYDPVFSPDGRSVAFVRVNSAYRISLSGGTPVLIPGLRGYKPFFVWLRDGTIIYHGDDGGLYRIPETGGTPARVASPDTAAGERNLNAIAMLPDERHLLVLGISESGSGSLSALDLSDGHRTTIIESGLTAARFLPPDHVVYTDERGALLTVPFDARALRLTGSPVQLANAISNTTDGAARFSTSETGAVLYMGAEPSDLVLVDRAGASQVISDAPRNYHNPRVSPDGHRILVDVQAIDGGRDAWIFDRAQRALTRATLAGDGHDAIWSRDGRSIVYMSARSGDLTAFRVPATGGGSPVKIVGGHGLNTVTDVTSDGTLLGIAYTRAKASDWDIVSFHPGDTLRNVVVTPFFEGWTSVSPDEKWLAYASNESGRSEVYVRRLDGSGVRLQISLDGATGPRWSPTGHELFYRRLTDDGAELMAATLTLSGDPRVESRRALFDAGEYADATPHTNYDVTPDGQHFVMVRPPKNPGLVYLQNVPALAGGGSR
jgi:serine/threonine-protein kinase